MNTPENKKPEVKQPEPKKVTEDSLEKEVDPDNQVHETSPDLIQKEDHHLEVDEEYKKG